MFILKKLGVRCLFIHLMCQLSQQSAKKTVLACPLAKNSTGSLKNSTGVSAPSVRFSNYVQDLEYPPPLPNILIEIQNSKIQKVHHVKINEELKHQPVSYNCPGKMSHLFGIFYQDLPSSPAALCVLSKYLFRHSASLFVSIQSKEL